MDRAPDWAKVASDPAAFLSVRLCSPAWLEAALPVLRAHAHDDGDAARAIAVIDERLAGGPLPDEVFGPRPALAAFVAGALASAIAFGAPGDTRDAAVQRIRRARIALPWAARALGLPPPDASYATIAVESLAIGVDAGRVSEADYHAGVEEVLIDAYLASDDPRQQSGKSGDETVWRWSRELVLDTFEGDATLLDVGCANGYLMESLHCWAAARGRTVEPYGLEISARMAALARRRLPQWADRIFVGNALDWTPPRRFDVVHTGLDYVLPHRRRASIRHLLERALVPGGVLVLRAPRIDPGEPTPAEELAALGFTVAGEVEAIHPTTGTRRATAWLRR